MRNCDLINGNATGRGFFRDLVWETSSDSYVFSPSAEMPESVRDLYHELQDASLLDFQRLCAGIPSVNCGDISCSIAPDLIPNESVICEVSIDFAMVSQLVGRHVPASACVL